MSPKYAKLESLLTIVFTPAMGKRIEVVRMNLNHSQTEAAALLGITQGTLSKIETGRMKICDRFTYEQFREVFGDATNFILTGANRASYDKPGAKKKFWESRWGRNRAEKRRRMELLKLSQS